LLFQHGESICNLFGRIGGDAELSERGIKVRRRGEEGLGRCGC